MTQPFFKRNVDHPSGRVKFLYVRRRVYAAVPDVPYLSYMTMLLCNILALFN